MIYHEFKDLKLSALGFGTMRLPLIPGGGVQDIDQQELDRMVDCAIAGGVNYFDTAYPYHGGCSELAIGKSLARYPRESFYLADKFPGHQIVKGVKKLDPETIFEEQLKKCGVEYFDFYLLHNINEHSMSYYGNPENKYLDYFLEQKANGRIKHLGFSCHSAADGLEQFLQMCGDKMEFCQIQLNYLDWTLQNAKKKCEILKAHGLPVWVMEPVRGGRLAKLDDDTEAAMRAARPAESTPAWAFRWLQTVPQPTMVLSGMTNLAQMQDNIRTFSEEKPLSGAELSIVYSAAEKLASFVPCTGCRYCCAGCPKKLDIPNLINLYNDIIASTNLNPIVRYGALPEDKRADACIGCGQCTRACPQMINVPDIMKKLAANIASKPTWEQMCKEREAAAEAAKKR